MAVMAARTGTLKDGIRVVIRSAVAADAAAFTHYAAKIFSSSRYLITQPEEFHGDVNRQREWIRSLQDNPCGLLLLAVDGEEIVGNLDFRCNLERKRVAHRGVIGMSVREEFRGRGVGRLLLTALLDWARTPDLAIEKIELGVLSENEPALRLYRSFGFQEEGRIKKGVKLGRGVYLDEMLMGLEIGAEARPRSIAGPRS